MSLNFRYAVETVALTKKFGDFTAVDQVSLRIPKGAIFGLLGPNGSGKSTTIRMLCCVLTPSSGKGTILGLDTQLNPERIKHNLGYMSQRFSLYEDLTVNENLDFYGGVYGIAKDVRDLRKNELVTMTGLRGKEKSLAGTLSGGLKQRLALSCALIHRPLLLVLDEPTAGVDPVSRKVFWEIIRTLSRQGITVLVTTHYMDEAEGCDIVGFIFNGRLINTAPPKDIIKSEGAKNLEDIFIKYVERITGTVIGSDFARTELLKKEDMV